MADEIKWSMTLNGNADPPGHRMVAALINGAINDVPTAHLEFVARNKKLDLGDLVGTEMGFWVEDEDSKRQPFWGTCISAESKGSADGEGLYVAEIRPWLWFLTRSKNNRIYQNKKTTDIVKDILGEYGFSGDLKVNHSGSDKTREYCVQYHETDLNFIKRLLEEEGFYFYFEHDTSTVKMILADQPSTHGSAGADDKYLFSDEKHGGAREKITDWKATEKAVTGKVTLRDYDFTKPSSDLTASSVLPSGSHGHKSYESYAYPGKYTDVSDGEKRAAALIEEQASGHQVWSGQGTMLNMNVGKIFEIKDHPRHEKAADNGFMVKDMAQFIQVTSNTLSGASTLISDPQNWTGPGRTLLDLITAAGGQSGEAAVGFFQTVFEAVLKSKPFRGLSETLRPQMTGVQTAVVTGASGDEIAVDKYGRIKVQFHWDRDGKKDDKTTCWVRTMMPWTGKNWGMVALPRVGQEVVIQFEEGDPDRPLCVGMLYNAETMPPYELPADATMTGIKTNSSKGGGGYNELMFEDKKGEELVRFMAEKDHVQNVQNQSHIKVGYDHPKDVRKAEAQADKSMKLEVQNHLDEIVETGDHSFTVSTGTQTIAIENDKTETNNANSKLTITDNYDTTVTGGDMSVGVDSGLIDIEAATSITLTCGQSVIKLEPSAITISSVKVDIAADTDIGVEAGTNLNMSAGVSLKAEGSASAEISSGGVTTVKGSLVQIN